VFQEFPKRRSSSLGLCSWERLNGADDAQNERKIEPVMVIPTGLGTEGRRGSLP